MIEHQPITIYWDSSCCIDENTLTGLKESGLRPVPMSLSEIITSLQETETEKGPKVVCLNSGQQQPLSESFIQKVKDLIGPKMYLILRVDRSSVRAAIGGIRGGADDVIADDADIDCWKQIASSARMRLLKFQSIVFVDEVSQNLLALIERVGASDVTALLQGPTGSGKEVLARLVHDFSARRNGPFIPVNCAALPENLAESLLFGHVKGSFTGATRDTEGFFSQADGGTLFLDEIGELQPLLQAKLLRVIQEREVLPVGSSKTTRVDVRIVSATNRNLKHLSSVREFREDLYFRLSTFRINVPSLVERQDDILPLANYFIVKHGRENQNLRFTPEALSRLISYDWPGNVRELENVIQRAIVLARENTIDEVDLVFDEDKFGSIHETPQGIVAFAEHDNRSHADSQNFSTGLQRSVEENEFRIIAEMVDKTKTKQEAAKKLGISDRTLRYKLAKMRDRGFSVSRLAG